MHFIIWQQDYWGQKAGYGSLNNNVPMVSETVWEGLEGMALLEKAYHWGKALSVQKFTPFPFRVLCASFPSFLLADKNVSSQLLLQHQDCLRAAMFPDMMVVDANPLEL